MAAPYSLRMRPNCASKAWRRSLTIVTWPANRSATGYAWLIRAADVPAKRTKPPAPATTSRDRHCRRRGLRSLKRIPRLAMIAAENHRDDQQRDRRQNARLRTNRPAAKPARPAQIRTQQIVVRHDPAVRNSVEHLSPVP